jgi:hypothetical protein
VYFNGAISASQLGTEQPPFAELKKLITDAAPSQELMTFRPLKIHYRIGDFRHANEAKKSVKRAAEFVADNFDPRGRLIVVGNSAGGINAIDLCRLLEAELGFYDFIGEITITPDAADMKRLGKMTKTAGTLSARVRVDHLFLHDAGFRVFAAERQKQRAVPAMVLNHKNHFMTDYNPPDNNVEADQDSEFHGPTDWTPEVKPAGNHNILHPAPRPGVPTTPFPELEPFTWNPQKKKLQEDNHVALIRDKLDPQTRKEITEILKGGLRGEIAAVIAAARIERLVPPVRIQPGVLGSTRMAG